MGATLSDGATSQYGLLDLLDVAKRRWIWVTGPILLAAGLMIFFTLNQAPRYEANAQVLLADTASQRTLDPSSQNTGFLTRELSNEILIATSDEVEELVAVELGDIPAVTIEAAPDADGLVFSAVASDPDIAALRANTWAASYISVKRQQAMADIAVAVEQFENRLESIQAERASLRQPLAELLEEIRSTSDPEEANDLRLQYDLQADDLRTELDLNATEAVAALTALTELNLQAELASVGEARIVQQAVAPRQTINAPLARNLPLALVVGGLMGAAITIFVEARDTRIRNTADLARVTDVPVLASVPRVKTQQEQLGLGLVVFRDSEDALAQSYHKVRTALEFASIETEVKSVLITSPVSGDGKSTTSSNLALALATVGMRTVLIDIDFRRPTIHKIYGIDQEPGIADSIVRNVQMASVSHSIAEPTLESLLVIPTGTPPPSPASFVGTEAFASSIKWLRDQADVVILDSPPLLAVSDALAVARHTDAVILVVRADQTTRTEVQESIAGLNQVGANLLGIVLIGVDTTENYYRYSDEARRSKPSQFGSGLRPRVDNDPIDLREASLR